MPFFIPTELSPVVQVPVKGGYDNKEGGSSGDIPFSKDKLIGKIHGVCDNLYGTVACAKQTRAPLGAGCYMQHIACTIILYKTIKSRLSSDVLEGIGMYFVPGMYADV